MLPFDGNYHAQLLDQIILKSVPSSNARNLAIIQVGNNPSSQKYVALKLKTCAKLGIAATSYEIPYTSSNSISDIESQVDAIINDASNTGIIIQLPLPDSSLYSLLDLIPPAKDLDLLSKSSKHAYYSGDFIRLPPVVRALEYFIKSNNIKLNNNLNTAVIGLGELVGKPVKRFLEHYGVSVTVIENYVAGDSLNYDLIVLSAGAPNLVQGEDLSEGCHIVDFGSSVLENRVVGDLNMNSDIDHLGCVSPSPGGMGPLTVRFLIMNHLGI